MRGIVIALPIYAALWVALFTVLRVALEFVVFVGLFLGVPMLVWLMAPAGGYPR